MTTREPARDTDAATPIPVPDFVDRVRDEWDGVFPDHDTSPIEILARISRISSISLAQLDRALRTADIGRAEFEVLGALMRSGHPLRASEVTSVTGSSGAATTKHAVRLERLGLITRNRLPRDGRVVLLEITDAGRRVVEDEFPRRLARDRHLLTGLDRHDRETLVRLLRVVTHNAETSTGE